MLTFGILLLSCIWSINGNNNCTWNETNIGTLDLRSANGYTFTCNDNQNTCMSHIYCNIIGLWYVNEILFDIQIH